MDIQTALRRLRGVGYPAKEYNGLIEIEMEPRVQTNELDRMEINVALNYEVPLYNIRQIDPWTIVITF